MKFVVPNYSCLQNPWLGGCRPQIPVLCTLSSTEFVEPPPTPRKKLLGTQLLVNSASLIISKITQPLKLGPGCSEEAFVRKTGETVNACILREVKCITRCCKHCEHSESITEFGSDVTFLWKRVLESSGLVSQCSLEVCLMPRPLYSWAGVSGTYPLNRRLGWRWIRCGR
jgi:hypothetical protein